MAVFDLHRIIGDVVDICTHTMDKKITIHQELAASRATILATATSYRTRLSIWQSTPRRHARRR